MCFDFQLRTNTAFQYSSRHYTYDNNTKKLEKAHKYILNIIRQLYVLQLLQKMQRDKIKTQQQDHKYETRHNQKHQRSSVFERIGQRNFS